MIYQYHNPALESYFLLSTHVTEDQQEIKSHSDLIHIYWNRSTQDIDLKIDGINTILKQDSLITSTYFHKIVFPKNSSDLVSFSFNREFYCIKDHDQEVSCNGILFFGAQGTPIIQLNQEEKHKFDILYEVFLDEFQNRDHIQGEMLVMLLKRLIIKTTRLAKEHHLPSFLDDQQIDIIRKFNVLVDMHFREKKQVSEYADLLFRSPKTLTNLFAKYQSKTPLQIIHERIILEAKRLLLYSNKSIKEIAYELGFNGSGSFHKLFKKITDATPQEYKNKYLEPISSS